jgi:hypothetical protein
LPIFALHCGKFNQSFIAIEFRAHINIKKREDVTMFRLHRLSILAFALVIAGAGWLSCSKAPAEEMSNEQSFKATITGDQVVPPVKTEATGDAVFKVEKDGSELHYTLNVKGIRGVLMAHIHLGEKGKNGPVVVWLYPSKPKPKLIPSELNGQLAGGTITEKSLMGPLKGKPLSDLIKDIKEGKTFVMVHTKKHKTGEIRGQIE